MPKNKDFALRIEIIDECLRNRFREWTLEKLLDEVNSKLHERYTKTTSKRTIQNDIKYLIEEKNAPIAKKKEGNSTSFYYIDRSFSIKNLPIEEEEINLLRDAIDILAQVNEFQILHDVEDIITKLQNTVSSNVIGRPSIIQFEKHTTAIGTQYIDDILAAIKGKTPLRITYQPFKAQDPKVYIFHPYLLKEYRNRWFLIGRKASATTITNFALDRIKEIKNSNENFIENDLFNVETYFNNLIGVTVPHEEKISIVEIKVTAQQAPYIKTKPIHHTQKIMKEYKKGDILIQLNLICNYELRSVLLGYGCDLEVIKPMTLRDELKETHKRAYGCYK